MSSNASARTFPRIIVSVATIVILIGIWQLYVSLAHVPPTVLASPAEVAQSTAATFGNLIEATRITACEGLIGFLISIVVGVLLGIGIYAWRYFHAVISPLLWIAQTLPLIAIAPLFVIWFGFESTGKIVLVAIFSIFPICVQTYRGLHAVPQFYSDVALTCGGSRAWTLWHVQLRVALRQIFAGLRISAAYVFATAATAEYLGARNGLGIYLQSAYNSFQTPLIFSATLAIIVLTGVLLGVITLVEHFWIGAKESE
jgi:ABC-type nitrate/sulfonate/bicarbonate transport system permease component